MTTLRTALRSAIDAGDPAVLARAGFGSVDADELRQVLAALADQSPANVGAVLDAAAAEPDVASMLTAARALTAAAPPEPLTADLVAGAEPTDELDFTPWQGARTEPAEPAPPAEPQGDADDFALDLGDDLDFGSGGEAAADHHLIPDLLDEADTEPMRTDESAAFAGASIDESDVDDPFLIGATDLDVDPDTDPDGADDDFL